MRDNAATVLARQPRGTRLIAVVKAGGYGHGAIGVARAALEGGASMLAVATPAEAAELRSVCSPEDVLVMGGLLPSWAADVVEIGCAVTCSTEEVARALSAAASGRGAPVPVHLKVDTGMARMGCAPDQAATLARLIAGLPGLRLAGTYTHFAASESDDAATRLQFELFRSVLAGLGVEPGLRHAANTGAALRHPEMALDAVRVGIALYGCEWPGTRPAMAVRASVVLVKALAAGQSVGYGSTWTAAAPARVATVAIGYADGVHRSRSRTGDVLVHGRRAPVIGRISMDSLSVDVTQVPGVEAGDTATLIGADGPELITAEEVAGWAGTISYEVLCAVGPRVQRLHSE